jgi:hypothetical protein
MALLDKILDTKGIVGQVVTEIGKHIPTPLDQTKKLELENALEQVLISKQAEIDIAQAEVNKAELEKEGWFYNAWRPAIAWVCIGALIQHWWVFPWVVILSPETKLPQLAIESLLTILLGLLGLGTQRMLEKKWNVNKYR